MVKTEEKKDQELKAYAVIETGGKQYRVSEGEIIKVEKLSDDYKEGDEVVFDSVLLTDDGEKTEVGDPYVKKTKVIGEFIENGRAKKVSVTRFRSKSRYFKRKGHRQHFTKVKIKSIK